MSKICNQCDEEFRWAMPYTGKKLNLDGTPHNCTVTPTTSSPPVVDMTPQIDEMIGRCTIFRHHFEELPDAKFDALARIFISGMMRK